MTKASRLLLTAAACVAVPASVAAQTVIVKGAAAGTTLEASMGTGAPIAGAADADHNLRAALGSLTGAAELSAAVYVDTCGTAVRVFVVAHQAAAPDVGDNCSRRTVNGVFVVRSNTTLVIDVTQDPPALLIAQGAPPGEWLGAGPAAAAERSYRTWRPTGLMLTGGGDLAHLGGYGGADCGVISGSPCSSQNNVLATTGGAEYWITPYVGAVVDYTKNAAGKASGQATTYNFAGQFQTDLLRVGGELLLPVHRVTLFATVGAAHHRARWTWNETINDATVTVGAVQQTLAGGTESWDIRTTGWDWTYGGGMNIWLSQRAAFRASFDYTRLKGSDLGGSEAVVNVHAPTAQLGVLFRVGPM